MSSPVKAKSDAEGFNASRGPVLHAELTQVFTQIRQLQAQVLELIGEMDADDIAQKAGYATIGIFLRAVDLIIEETPPPAESGPGEPPAPRDCSSAGDSSATRF